jgi:hypothetical protein
MKKISAKEFDRKFDANEDINEYLDPKTTRVVKLKPKRINVDQTHLVDSRN